MSIEVEKQSPIPSSSVCAMPSEIPPQLFWDLEQRKYGEGWEDVAKMEDPPHEYQVAACFLPCKDRKRFAPSIFTTQGRLCKYYENLRPFREASQKFCRQRAREAQKEIVPAMDLAEKDDSQKTSDSDTITSLASSSLAPGYDRNPTPENRIEISDSANTSVQSWAFNRSPKPTDQVGTSTELVLSLNQQSKCGICRNSECCTHSRCRHSWTRCCQCQKLYHKKCARTRYRNRKSSFVRRELAKSDWRCMKCLEPIKEMKKRRVIPINTSTSLSGSNGKEDNSQPIAKDAPHCKLDTQLEAVAGELGRSDVLDDLSSEFVMRVLGSLSSSIDQIILDVELGQLAIKAREGKHVPFEELSILSENKIQQHQQSHPLVSVLRDIYGIDSGQSHSLKTRVNRLDETRISAHKLFKLVVVYLLHHLVFSSSPFHRTQYYTKSADLLENGVESSGSDMMLVKRWKKDMKLWMYRSDDNFHAQVKRESTKITQEMEEILSPLAEFFGDEKRMLPGLENMVYAVSMFNARLKAESDAILTSWAATGAQYDDTLHKKVNNLDSDQVLYTARFGVFIKRDDGEIITYAPAKLEMYSREDII